MNDLFDFAAHNTVASVVLAILVYIVTRVWRSPPFAHLLWLLVLLKLVTPPIVRIDWSNVRPPTAPAPSGMVVDDLTAKLSRIEGSPHPPDRGLGQMVASRRDAPRVAAKLHPYWHRAQPALIYLWLGGTGLCAVIAVTRVVRFERRLHDTLPVSQRLRRLALEIAARLGVRELPELRYAAGVETPFLWWAGRRPVVVLPMRLLDQLDDERAALILAHELAHLRRRDHWVRVVELLISVVYWWHPLVWLVRRRLHQAEEQSCDAWVCWTLPGCGRRYAEILLQLAESLGGRTIERHLLPASPFLRSYSLKARIEMILQNRCSPRVTLRAMCFATVMAVLVLAFSFETQHKNALAAANDDSSAAKSENAQNRAASEFPYTVDFEQGVMRFAEGDNITILEVRGTAETFKPGHIYWIRGTYKLASHEKAMLAAYTTAMDAENASSQPFQVQHAYLDAGEGTFTLFLPMSCRGWPHVSFYADGGSFSGNYFGTGDSVLRRWWGSEESEKTTINISADGKIEFDHQVLSDLEELTRRLVEARRQDPGLSVSVRADGEARYQRVADVLKACKQAGVAKSKIAIK
ncbi:MAG TPA: M56 family metallopeptidase [Pirellulales bacterium]|nr:M56 family metallopeptidase [Pirellulales bacterium]